MIGKFTNRIGLGACLAGLLWAVSASQAGSYEAAEAANREGNREAAFHHFKQAASRGDARAYGKLGAMYLYGLGTSRDYARAYVWFSLAEQEGDSQAERYRMAASSAMTRQQVVQAQQLIEQQRRELASWRLPPIE